MLGLLPACVPQCASGQAQPLGSAQPLVKPAPSGPQILQPCQLHCGQEALFPLACRKAAQERGTICSTRRSSWPKLLSGQDPVSTAKAIRGHLMILLTQHF